MKIAHIVCVFPPYKGGMGNSAFQFARAVAGEGHEVTVFTPNYAEEPDREPGDGFEIVRLKPWIKIGNAAVMPGIVWQLRKFDVIHLHYPFYGTAEIVWLAKKLSGKKMKLVIHYHMDPSAGGLKGLIFGIFRRIFQPLVLKSADAVSCASLDYLANSTARKIYIREPYKFQETYFGVDLDRFSPGERAAESSNPVKLLFVAGLDRAHYFKGLNILLEAIETIESDSTENNFKIKLFVVGEGDMKEYYKKKTEKLGIDKSVKFLGNLNNDELAECYRQADLFVLPSVNRGEAFGLVLLEAMASGLPVIASDLPGVKSVFNNGVEGFYAKPGDSEELAKKIIEIAADPEKRQRMGAAGRKLCEEKYDWPAVGARLTAIYEDLLDK